MTSEALRLNTETETIPSSRLKCHCGAVTNRCKQYRPSVECVACHDKTLNLTVDKNGAVSIECCWLTA